MNARGVAPNEAAYRQLLAELGATPNWETWEGLRKAHKIICENGHERSPRPDHVLSGQGICRICKYEERSRKAEAEVRELLAQLGATPDWTEWLGAGKPHRVICKRDHVCHPYPTHIKQGGTPCLRCVALDRGVEAERIYRERLEMLGAVPAWDEWSGSQEPHRVICPARHPTLLRLAQLPSDHVPCRTCAGQDPVVVERKFRERLAELDAQPAWSEWNGADEPHAVICAAGHACSPQPSNVLSGQGPCRFCIGRYWDVFYVVANDSLGTLKFGITSGDPRPRLRTHRGDGYRRTIFLASGLEDARGLELEMMATLEGHGHQAVRGLEYFRLEALDLVLKTLDSFEASNDLAA